MLSTAPKWPSLHQVRLLLLLARHVYTHAHLSSLGTLVPLPPSRAPRDWRSFLTYYKEIFMQRFADRLQILQQTQELKEGRLWHRATFRAQRKGVVEAALNLHAAMSHDLARGGQAERTHLTQFCVPKLARSLVAAIESRPAGKRYEWERVALTGKPLWPRLVDHKWTDIDLGYAKKASFRQAVVGIKSQQKLTELDRRGKPVKTKEMELLEYVVLWCRVDKVNRTFGDWQLYGTLKETSYEELIKERELTKSIGDMHAARGLMQRKKQLEEK